MQFQHAKLRIQLAGFSPFDKKKNLGRVNHVVIFKILFAFWAVTKNQKLSQTCDKEALANDPRIFASYRLFVMVGGLFFTCKLFTKTVWWSLVRLARFLSAQRGLEHFLSLLPLRLLGCGLGLNWGIKMLLSKWLWNPLSKNQFVYQTLLYLISNVFHFDPYFDQSETVSVLNCHMN